MSLVRLPNCLVAAAGVALGAVMTSSGPAYYGQAMASLTAGLVCAAGNVVNDLVDVEIDRINRPERVMVRQALSSRYAIGLAVGLNLVALTLAASINLHVFLSVTAAIVVLLWYNLSLKQRPLVGNATVAFLGGLTFMTGGWAVSPPAALALPGPLIPAVFAFLMHMTREIVKDVEDVSGDRACDLTTFPQLVGTKRALAVALGIFAFLSLLTMIPVVAGWFGWAYGLVTGLAIDIPLTALLIVVWLRPERRLLGLTQQALKLGMVVGVIALLLA